MTAPLSLAILAFVAGATSLPGDDSATPPPERVLIHREVPDDPPRPHRISTAPPYQAPWLHSGGPTPGVQVNVDGSGQNIVGDAANEPSMAVDPLAPNRLVIGWRQFDTTVSNFRQAGWAYSHDGGRTWTFPGVIEPGIFRSDPVLDADSNGNFYYYSLTIDVNDDFICHLFKSTDGGLTWGPGVFGYGGDKQWMSIDRTGGIGNGNLYAAWSPFFSCCPGNFTITRRGTPIFSIPIALPVDVFWGTTAIRSDGALFISGVDLSFTPLILRSSNAQNSQETPVFELITGVSLNGQIVQGGGPNPGGLLGQVWVEVDTSGGPLDGNIYVVCSVNPPGSDPMDVMFARSEDGGATWSSPVRVNDDPTGTNAWQWFGTMDVAQNGRIDVVWNDTRASGQTNISELYYSSSDDGGVTWTTNEPLSPSFDSLIGWPNQNKIGDYYHLRSDRVGAHLAWAATFNGEQDVYYRRIGDYDCNGNGVADTDDLAGASDDCNRNGIPDECDIAAGLLADANGNGVPDVCETIPGDLDGDGDVDINDLLALLAEWGPCSVPPNECPGDLDGDGMVGIIDLLMQLANWS